LKTIPKSRYFNSVILKIILRYPISLLWNCRFSSFFFWFNNKPRRVNISSIIINYQKINSLSIIIDKRENVKLFMSRCPFLRKQLMAHINKIPFPVALSLDVVFLRLSSPKTEKWTKQRAFSFFIFFLRMRNSVPFLTVLLNTQQWGWEIYKSFVKNVTPLTYTYRNRFKGEQLLHRSEMVRIK
jgi:hypothetical protein